LLITTVVRSLVIYDSQALTRQEFRKSVAPIKDPTQQIEQTISRPDSQA